MKCDICGKRESSLYCKKCGSSFCMTCHSKFGSVGLFKGKCAKCGNSEVVRRG